MATETLDLSKIRKGLQIEDQDLLKKYLKEIWSDLSKRATKEDTSKGMNKVTFNKYYELPGIISERLFAVFDKDKDGVLSQNEFVNGMKSVFSQAESFDSLARFIFDFYDFRSCEKIQKDDVRVVLSYVPLQKNELSANTMKDENIVKENFQDRVESQEQLFNILNIAFKNKKEIDYTEYLQVIKNVNSDIFILILMFLLEKKPFSNATIKIYSAGNEKRRDASPSLKVSKQVIASPSLNSRFLSPKLKKKSLMVGQKGKLDGGKGASILQLYSGVDNKPVDIDRDKKEEKKKEDKEKQRPQRRVRIKLDNLMDKTPEISKNSFTFGKGKTNVEDGAEKNDDDFDLDLQEENYVQYEGYVYKYSQTHKTMKKTYFRLIGKDLYFYKKKEDKTHRGMHNLSGVFIKKGDDFEVGGKKYLTITILYQEEKSYYFDNHEDFKIWFDKLNTAIENKSLFDKYEVKQKIGRGKFGLVKEGIHKESKQKVAIKIMSKKNMDKSDMELAKVEIDILKISQHPNIIKLYDVFENEQYIYIIMEYCSGGDLLTYFENHNYELPESKVCEIIHKLSMAVYYIHSYGIVHRDLKPENILMTDSKDTADIRLLDFGLSKIIGNDEKCTEPYGTLSFVAPEVLQGKPYDKSVDLWSIGIITFLLLCGYMPFDDEHSEKEIARQTIQDPVPYENKIWSKLSREAKTFVDGLLQKKPEKRYTIKEVLEHPWIKKMDKVPEQRKDAQNNNASQFGVYTQA